MKDLQDQHKAAIRERFNLHDLITSHIKLTPSGTGYRGQCPRCQNVTDKMTFYYSTRYDRWNCAECGDSGEQISFIMLYRDCSYLEAMDYLVDLLESQDSNAQAIDRFLQQAE